MPTNGSAAILKASALNGSVSSGVRMTSAPVFGVEPDHRRDVERRRQVVDDRVEHLLDALVAERRAGQDRDDPRRERAEAEAALDLGDRQLLALEVLVGQLVVHLGDGLDHRVAVLLGLGLELVRDVDDVERRCPGRRGSRSAFISTRSTTPWNWSSRPIGIWIGTAFAPRRSRDRLDAAPEVGAGPVELVDEAEARHAVAVGLAPDRLGLGLDTGHAVEDDDRAVEDAEAPLDLDREVHVPGRIDDVDAMIAPERRRRSRGDRDPALLLLGHPVHRRGAFVDLADLVDLLRVEEDPLGDGRLARVDMGDDSDVPRACQRNLSCHGVL